MPQLQTSIALNTIPPEIRLRIHEYLLLVPKFLFITPPDGPKTTKPQKAHRLGSVSVAILSVCKLFHREAHSVLLRNNVFQFLYPLMRNFSSPLRPSALRCLRTVILGPYQCTAKAAMEDMTATRHFLQSACPSLETLSTRLWLVRHTGAEIDMDKDVAPVVDTTWIYDTEDATPDRSPVRYTMGILRTANPSDESATHRKGEVNMYSVLEVETIEKSERASLLGLWVSVTIRALLGVVRLDQHMKEDPKQVLKKRWNHVAVCDAIETEWKGLAEELDHKRLLFG